MNGLMDRILLARTLPPTAGPRPEISNEPLDLSKPLDLSAKSKNQTSVATNEEPVSSIILRKSSAEIQCTNTYDPIHDPKVLNKKPGKPPPPLGATKYPLQRGLAYVQPQRSRTIFTEERQPQKQILRYTPHIERVSRDVSGDTPMYQRLQMEAANMAAMQSQITQAAQAAVRMAIARQQELAKKNESNLNEIPSTPNSIQGSANRTTKTLIRRKRSHTSRLASVNPVQRHMSSADTQQYTANRQLAQLASRRASQSERDLLYPCRTAALSAGIPPHTSALHFLNQTQACEAYARRHVDSSELSTKEHLVSRLFAVSAGEKISHNGYPRQKAGTDFAAQVKAREQAIIKQQQELILLRQRQLVEDVNNNRKIIEYAKREQERRALIKEFNYRLNATDLKTVENHHASSPNFITLKGPQTSSNPGFNKAIAAYTAAQSLNGNLQNPSPSMPVLVPQRKTCHELLSRSSKGSSYTSSHRTSSRTPAEFSPAALASASQFQSSACSSDLRMPGQRVMKESQSMRDAKQEVTDTQQRRRAQEALFNAAKVKRNTESALFHSRKLSSIPVRDRLLLARMSEQERQEFLLLSRYGQLKKKARRLKPPQCTTQNAARASIQSGVCQSKVDVPFKGNGQNENKSNQHSINGNRRQHNSHQNINVENNVFDLSSSSPSKPPTTTAAPQAIRSTFKHASCLPSYEDAIAAQKVLANATLSPDDISTMARRLVSSSQAWLKKYLGQDKERNSEKSAGGPTKDRNHGEKAHMSLSASTVQPSNKSENFDRQLFRSSPTKEIRREEMIPTHSASRLLTPATFSSESTCTSHAISIPSPLDVHIKQEEINRSEEGVGNEGSFQNTLVPTGKSHTPPASRADTLSHVHIKSEDVSVNDDLCPPLGRSMSHDPRKKLLAALVTDMSPTESKTGSNVESPDALASFETAEGSHRESQSVPSGMKQLKQKEVNRSSGLRHEAVKMGQKENDLMQADTASLGREERALQRAILRFNELEKQVPSKINRGGEKGRRGVLMKANGVRKRRKRKLSKFRRRMRTHLLMPVTTDAPVIGRKRGRPRRSSLPSAFDLAETRRSKFQDFVPIILPSRTRNAGSGHVQNYRSMYDARNVRYEMEIEKERAKFLERRLRLRQNSVSVSTSDTEDTTTHENLEPPVKRRPRGRPRKRPLDEHGGGLSETLLRTLTDTPSCSSASKGDSESSPSHPFRVVMDENSSNHIKMKFVNMRKIHSGFGEDQDATQPPRRRRGRPPKSARRRNANNKKHVTSNSPAPPQLEIMSRGHIKEISSDCDSLAQAPEFESIDIDVTSTDFFHTSVIRPEPPQEMRKLIVNKKLGETLLHRAATLGSMEIISYLVDYRVIDVNASDNAGYTALHESCVQGHLDVATYLLRHGADVNASAADGTRPIHDAVDNDRVELCRLLLAYGADPFLSTYSGRRTTKLALARSSEMKTLLFGYLRDVNGERTKLEDSPQLTLDYQWTFNGSCSLFDSSLDSAMDIFADVPEPDHVAIHLNCDVDDGGVFFEISEKPMLPSVNVRLDGHDKFRNWLLLGHVADRLSLTDGELLATHPELRPVTLPAEQFQQLVKESQVSKSAFATISSKDAPTSLEVEQEEVTLLELNDNLRKALGIEVAFIK